MNIMTASTTLRSKTYMDVFPDDEMLEAFGHLHPNVTERNAYFFDKWMEWRVNRIKIKGVTNKAQSSRTENEIKNICKTIGLREFWDFQVKPGEVRFAQADYMAMFRIKWGNNG